jgi:hypothetical protein
MAALMAMMTMMLIGLGAAAPLWHYVVQDSKEQELLHRGLQIVRGIEIYMRRSNGQGPLSLQEMVKAQDLRREYKDPMTEDGEWHLIRQNVPEEGCGTPTTVPGGEPPPEAPSPPPQLPGQPAQGVQMPIIGVRSKNEGESIRVFLGRNHYNEWCFTAGQSGSVPPNTMYSRYMTGVRKDEAEPPFSGDRPGVQKRDWGRLLEERSR